MGRQKKQLVVSRYNNGTERIVLCKNPKPFDYELGAFTPRSRALTFSVPSTTFTPRSRSNSDSVMLPMATHLKLTSKHSGFGASGLGASMLSVVNEKMVIDGNAKYVFTQNDAIVNDPEFKS